MALERGTCVIQDVGSVFDTDGFQLIMDWVAGESGVAYGEIRVATKAHRVLADHGRAMSFLIADGVTPSNEGRGYICRRIIRRAVQHGQRIGLDRVYRLPAWSSSKWAMRIRSCASMQTKSSASFASKRSASARRSLAG